MKLVGWSVLLSQDRASDPARDLGYYYSAWSISLEQYEPIQQSISIQTNKTTFGTFSTFKSFL